jgi:hypothetical protein
MRLQLFLAMGVFIFAMAVVGLARPVAPPAQPEDPNWQSLAPGIAYRQYRLADPNNVFVARMEISRTNVTLESGLGSGYLVSGLETVSGIAARYDQALSQWNKSDGWGSSRSDVVVAINGDYFAKDGSGLPLNGMVTGGWFIKRFNQDAGRTGFGWKFSRTPFIGECVHYLLEKQIVQFADGSTQNFHGINVERGTDQLIIYTPQYDTRTPAQQDGVEVLVTLNQPAIVYPSPKAFTGVVQKIYTGQGSTTMLFDQIVLSASGDAANDLIAHVSVGDVISISQEISSRLEFECNTSLSDVDWSKTYASIGGDYYFLKAGQPKTYDCAGTAGFCNRLPRTAIAYNNQYVYFIVVDGRDLVDSIGMTVPELTIFARDTLSASYGVTQDSGGSSTMVVNGAVVNNTFCNDKGCVSKIYLPMIVKSDSSTANLAPQQPYPGPAHDAPSANNTPSATNDGRPIANGMMMVVIEPEQRSAANWNAGQAIVLVSNANLRLGPGTNYASQGVISSGTTGTIQAHSLNGVQAKGYFWWKVRLNNNQEGWLAEESLAIP